MIRFYLLPLEIVIKSIDPYQANRSPKYFTGTEAIPMVTCKWESTHYGLNDVCLIKAEVSIDQHNLLKSQPDVIAFPAQLDSIISDSAIANTSNKLSEFNIPTDLISNAITYRAYLKRVYKLFEAFRLLHSVSNTKIFTEGFTLNSKYSELNLKTQNALKAVASILSIDASAFTGNYTVKSIIIEFVQSQSDNIDMMN